jgi:hypothetical protein
MITTMNDFASKIQVTFRTPVALHSELLEHA